jgi:hypothetical protein
MVELQSSELLCTANNTRKCQDEADGDVIEAASVSSSAPATGDRYC